MRYALPVGMARGRSSQDRHPTEWHVRGCDVLTLQTCTPIPSFEKRLIVRAERV